jgi:molybdopterin-guanine dinucleotide biosynthesis protein A
MGTDKAFLEFKSKTLIEYIIDQVKVLSDDLIIISNKPDEHFHLGYPVYEDIHKDVGVLGGLHAGLFYAKYPEVVMIGCDMPFHNIKLLEYMIKKSKDFDIVIPIKGKDKYEPFRAIYSKSCLPFIGDAIYNNKKRMVSFFEDVNVFEIKIEKLSEYGDVEKLLMNINTKEDLNKARNIEWRI